MERGVLAGIVGFILAVLFAGTMGLSVTAVLVADYMQPGRVMGEQARQTLILCAGAGFFAALLAWWMQRFAASRGLLIRFVYGLLIFTLIFLAIGGVFEVGRNYVTNQGPHDYSPAGLYWASLGGFYTFALFLVVPLRLALISLLLAAGLFLALVGPIARDA
ncbi:MAG: hypothetical protein MI824_12495 [Hyphomicrobiales bacterium]|nr:hypothetical protein [Hyphomicrobiales bacterium]